MVWCVILISNCMYVYRYIVIYTITYTYYCILLIEYIIWCDDNDDMMDTVIHHYYYCHCRCQCHHDMYIDLISAHSPWIFIVDVVDLIMLFIEIVPVLPFNRKLTEWLYCSVAYVMTVLCCAVYYHCHWVLYLFQLYTGV